MFGISREKYGMRARAIEETRKELANRFAGAEMWRVVDDQDCTYVILEGSLTACFEHILQEKEGTLESGEYNEAGWEHKDRQVGSMYNDGYYDYEDLLELIDEHKYIYEFYREHVGNIQEDYEATLDAAIVRLRDERLEEMRVTYIAWNGECREAFAFSLDDIEPDNPEFWSRRGNPRPGVIKKIMNMELETWE